MVLHEAPLSVENSTIDRLTPDGIVGKVDLTTKELFLAVTDSIEGGDMDCEPIVAVATSVEAGPSPIRLDVRTFTLYVAPETSADPLLWVVIVKLKGVPGMFNFPESAAGTGKIPAQDAPLSVE